MSRRPPDFIVAVVDDDQSILESLENLLESAGHAVRLFASPAALLKSSSLAEIDFLISDIDMPEIDGFELSQLVHTARPDLPVILITGHRDIGIRSSGHYRFFQKPFDGEELLSAIDDALRRPQRKCARRW